VRGRGREGDKEDGKGWGYSTIGGKREEKE